MAPARCALERRRGIAEPTGGAPAEVPCTAATVQSELDAASPGGVPRGERGISSTDAARGEGRDVARGSTWHPLVDRRRARRGRDVARVKLARARIEGLGGAVEPVALDRRASGVREDPVLEGPRGQRPPQRAHRGPPLGARLLQPPLDDRPERRVACPRAGTSARGASCGAPPAWRQGTLPRTGAGRRRARRGRRSATRRRPARRPPWPSACSGDMYCTLPITVPSPVSTWPPRRLHLGDAEVHDLELVGARPVRHDEDVLGLDVRWMMPLACAAASPSAIGKIIWTACWTDSRPRVPSHSASERPSRSSMTRNGSPVSVLPKSRARTIAGCRSLAVARASRRSRSAATPSSYTPTEHLDGHVGVQRQAARPPHRAHPTFTEQSHELVLAREQVARREARASRGEGLGSLHAALRREELRCIQHEGIRAGHAGV